MKAYEKKRETSRSLFKRGERMKGVVRLRDTAVVRRSHFEAGTFEVWMVPKMTMVRQGFESEDAAQEAANEINRKGQAK